MYFTLDVNSIDISKPIDNFKDILLYGGQMLLIGIFAVFGVLTTLWFTLVIFKFFFHDLMKGRKAKEVKSESAPIYSAPVVSDDEEIIAVIAAAIAMAESECGGGKKFRVVSFNRK